MHLYTSIGPNPHFVHMFMGLKGIELPQTQVDIVAGENRQAAFLKINPNGTTPVLRLDNGVAITETVAICEYLEDLHPAKPLIGANAEERAIARMWVRRVELGVVVPMTAGFRGAEGYALFKDRVRCLPQVSVEFKEIAQEGLAFINGQLGGQDYLAGARLTLADLMLFAFIQFGEAVAQSMNPTNVNLLAWKERVAGRVKAVEAGP
jgi:glutathione S-transferase